MVVITNFIIAWELVLAVSGYLGLYDFTNLNYYDLSLEANFCTSEKLFFFWYCYPATIQKKKVPHYWCASHLRLIGPLLLSSRHIAQV